MKNRNQDNQHGVQFWSRGEVFPALIVARGDGALFARLFRQGEGKVEGPRRYPADRSDAAFLAAHKEAEDDARALLAGETLAA